MTYWICVGCWWIASGVIAAHHYRGPRNQDPIGQHKTDLPLLWLAVFILPLALLGQAIERGFSLLRRAWNHGRER